MNAADGHRIGRALRCLAALGVAASAYACSTLPSPRGWARLPDQAGQDPRGAWVNVRCRSHGHPVMHSGELLAVGEDSLFISTSDVALLPIAWDEVRRVQAVFFDPKESSAYGLGPAGGLATLGTGWFVFIGFPVWLAVGAGVGGARVDEAVVWYPQEVPRSGLGPYARFPQGLPRDLRRAVPATVGPPGAATTQEPGASPSIPSYVPPDRTGSGIVASGGASGDGKAIWSIGYHQHVRSELYLTAGYSRLDDEGLDLDQWWVGARVGEPLFAGVKYIYTSHLDQEGSGISAFGGFIAPTTEHVAFGAMVGYDAPELELVDAYYWFALMLELVLFPAK